MDFTQRRSLLLKWGQWLSEAAEDADLLAKAQSENLWFTPASVVYACRGWALLLQEESLDRWLDGYPALKRKEGEAAYLGLVLAGNIPCVGLHDVVCGLISGLNMRIKMSSKDQVLLTYLLERSYAFDDRWRTILCREEGRLKAVDAVIATGGREATAVFQEYFSSYPHLVRGHRNSCALLRGDERTEDLLALSEDMFRYFGLGCRNVTLLFVPRGYSLAALAATLSKAPVCEEIRMHSSYQNNYTYQRALGLLGQEEDVDGGGFLLRRGHSLSAPLGVVHCREYDQESELSSFLLEEASSVQCVVTSLPLLPQAIPFGQAQLPALHDYADEVDTLHFLSQIHL